MPNALADLAANDLAIIERFDRPWRLTNIEGREGDAIYVTGGFEYSAITGERIGARPNYSKNERLVPVTREGIAYLLMLAFQQEFPRVELRAVPRAQRRRVAELMTELARITELDLGALTRLSAPDEM